MDISNKKKIKKAAGFVKGYNACLVAKGFHQQQGVDYGGMCMKYRQ